MMNAQKILKAYTDELSATRKKLSELEKRAARVNGQQQDYRAAQGKIEGLRRQADDLRAERVSLHGEYADSLFEGSVSEQQRVTRRRAAIDKELEQTSKDIRSRVQSLKKPDPQEVAEIAAECDSLLNLPSYTDLLEKLEEVLEAEKDDIRKGIVGVKLPSGMDQDTYREKREALDKIYASQKQAERFYAKQDAERKAKLERLPKADNTDQYHAQLGTPRSLSGGNMTVLESGREARPYSLGQDD